MYTTPLATLKTAAKNARTACSLKYMPVIYRSLDLARQCAAMTKAHVVMHGEDAYWVVCMADAARLEAAGYEWAA